MLWVSGGFPGHHLIHFSIFTHQVSQTSLDLRLRTIQVKNVTFVRSSSWLNKLKQESSNYFNLHCYYCPNMLFCFVQRCQDVMCQPSKVIPRQNLTLRYQAISSCVRATIMPSLTGTCSSICFLFMSMYICLALCEEKHICSVAFQSTQAVCLYKVVNLACPSWQMWFFYILWFCVHLTVKQENYTAFKFQ